MPCASSRLRPWSWLLAVLVSPALADFVGGSDPKPMPDGVPKPAVGAPYTDPVFGTKGVRLTNARSSRLPGLFPQYSKRQAWNADESRLLLFSDDGYVRMYDGQTYQFLKRLDGVGGEDVFWHPTDPNLILYTPYDNRLMAYDVATGKRYRIHQAKGFTFANTRSEGNLSADALAYAFVASTYTHGNTYFRKFVLLDLTPQGGKIVGRPVSSLALPRNFDRLDWVSVSPSGSYVVADYADTERGRFHGVEVFDRQFRRIWQKPLGAGHSDLGFDENGDEILVMDVYDAENDVTHVMKYRLSDGQETQLLTFSARFDQHFSLRNTARRGWVYVSTFDYSGRLTDSAANWLPFEDEVFALKLDGSGTVERLAHHHSRRYSPQTPDSDRSVYYAEPHATASPRGDRLLFGSNWRQRMNRVDSVDAYVIDLRAP